ncbi:hypothetical protein BKI52_04985 [marine bacterium AO1-C]|nr:hypothetical protein BKI52_04985 [marine bacterium AO1-C]
MRAFAKFCYICYMDGFQIFIYIIIAIIYLVYKANSGNNKNKKPVAKTPPRRPANNQTTGNKSTASADLESFLQELSKDIGKPEQTSSYRSLEQESINYDKTAQNYDKPTRNRFRRPASTEDDFAKVQEAQQQHAKSVSTLNKEQKKRLGHAKSVSTLSEEQRQRLEHAKSISKGRQAKKKKIIKGSDDVRKAFIMSEILKRKYD